ncbi:endoglucanase 25-like [Mangifera indica]|uniref:endoglucanase 25-like n=1 Tax=Mangifera indica TaxID=29780 RepID=UPI001CF9FA0E|nr:endoglucanase 25-like [Mangifera indica]
MPYSLGSSTQTSASHAEMQPVRFVHSVSAAGRLLPSASRWNSIEIEFNLAPKSSTGYDSLPSRYSKSFDYDLVITDRKYFKRFLVISASVLLLIPLLVLPLHFLPRKHHLHEPSKNLTLALSQALTFFDAQKSGNYPSNSLVNFRGNSGLKDGSESNIDLVGGFYDSGNNIKFSFPTAYTVTLLSWTVIEYHEKYADIGELDHVKDIIKWGSDYLLKVTNSSSNKTVLYSQVGAGNGTGVSNDLNCWQRPEDMSYKRPISKCNSTASDLAGEIIAALSAASMVFREELDYSGQLIKAAEKLYGVATIEEDTSHKQGTYTSVEACGGEAREFYNSTGYKDELVWGGTWLSFATGNISYLEYATRKFKEAADEEKISEKGIFYWNNKLIANQVLLARVQFFRDLGYPYEDALGSSSKRTEELMCSYLSNQIFHKTKGGLILLKPNFGQPLQFAATASFLSKLYSDYLELLQRSGGVCSSDGFSLKDLRSFSMSQVNYILGDNPMKMSYMVGFGDNYPTQVHHRSASIPWDGQYYSCEEGDKWLNSKEPNPNVLLGAMVAGPDEFDNFTDDRGKPLFSEPSIASNAGLVAALIALHDPPHKSSNLNVLNLGIDQLGIFDKIRQVS